MQMLEQKLPNFLRSLYPSGSVIFPPDAPRPKQTNKAPKPDSSVY